MDVCSVDPLVDEDLDIRMLDDERGAGVVATRDIDRGEVVAVIPLATMVTSAHTALNLKRKLNVTFHGYHQSPDHDSTTKPRQTRSELFVFSVLVSRLRGWVDGESFKRGPCNSAVCWPAGRLLFCVNVSGRACVHRVCT